MRFRVIPTCALLAALAPAATAQAEPRWPPAAEATIRPGASMLTTGGQCTANFVFYDAT